MNIKEVDTFKKEMAEKLDEIIEEIPDEMEFSFNNKNWAASLWEHKKKLKSVSYDLKNATYGACKVDYNDNVDKDDDIFDHVSKLKSTPKDLAWWDGTK